MISIYHLDYFIVENFVQEGERSKDDENSKIQMKARDSVDSDENGESLDTPTNPARLNANDAVEDTPCS